MRKILSKLLTANPSHLQKLSTLVLPVSVLLLRKRFAIYPELILLLRLRNYLKISSCICITSLQFIFLLFPRGILNRLFIIMGMNQKSFLHYHCRIFQIIPARTLNLFLKCWIYTILLEMRSQESVKNLQIFVM